MPEYLKIPRKISEMDPKEAAKVLDQQCERMEQALLRLNEAHEGQADLLEKVISI